MQTSNQTIGVVGLGRMGGGLSLQALNQGIGVVGFSSDRASAELLAAGLVEAPTLSDFRRMLEPPRTVFLYVPAGPTVDQILDGLANVLDPGDIVVDGGNSYWGDSKRRADRLRSEGLHLVDLGTSGGIRGAREGACFMAGGEEDVVRYIEPILRKLAAPGGYVYAGGAGAGHFTKLVHNGIEFGMLQAIGEGLALLEAYRGPLPIGEILRCWRSGSVLRSWLIDLMAGQYQSHEHLQGVPSYVDDTGEVNWLVTDALEMDVPVPVIAASVMQLLESRDGSHDAAKAIALMRQGFGGHALGRSPSAENERRHGRVGR